VVYKKSSDATRRAQRGVTALTVAGLLLAAGIGSAFAADDPILSRLQGEWVGQGTVRMSPTAAPERIYCKVDNKLVDGGSAIEQKGRCAVATNSGSLKGKIAARGDGRYEGSLDSPQTAGPATLAGHAADNKIVLSAEFIDRFSRRPSLSIISLSVGENGQYRLTSDTLNPESGKHFQTSDIVFKPNKTTYSKRNN
jgi:hypothetical protein